MQEQTITSAYLPHIGDSMSYIEFAQTSITVTAGMALLWVALVLI